MIRISNIKIYEDISDDKVINIALNKYKIKQEDIILCKISKKSVDARKKDDVHYSYSIDLKFKNENKLLKNKNISSIKEFEFPNFDIKKDKKNSEKTIFIFEETEKLLADLSSISI